MNISEIASSILLFAAKVARRGKAAKGTINVATFGKPIVDSEGIAREFDYSAYAAMPLEAIVEAAKKLAAHVNLSMALAEGIDIYLRSQTKQDESIMATLAGTILSMDLAENQKQAEGFAVNWMRTVTDCGMDLEAIFLSRKAAVDKLKAAGKWKVAEKAVEKIAPVLSAIATTPAVSKDMAPRLVK